MATATTNKCVELSEVTKKVRVYSLLLTLVPWSVLQQIVSITYVVAISKVLKQVKAFALLLAMGSWGNVTANRLNHV